MAQRESIVIDISDSEDEQRHSPATHRQSEPNSDGAARSQRPAFMSPWATSVVARPPVPDHHFITPETSVSPHDSSDSDDEVAEISAAHFLWNARKSRNGIATHTLHSGNQDEVNASLAKYKASQTPSKQGTDTTPRASQPKNRSYLSSLLRRPSDSAPYRALSGLSRGSESASNEHDTPRAPGQENHNHAPSSTRRHSQKSERSEALYPLARPRPAERREHVMSDQITGDLQQTHSCPSEYVSTSEAEPHRYEQQLYAPPASISALFTDRPSDHGLVKHTAKSELVGQHPHDIVAANAEPAITAHHNRHNDGTQRTGPDWGPLRFGNAPNEDTARPVDLDSAKRVDTLSPRLSAHLRQLKQGNTGSGTTAFLHVQPDLHIARAADTPQKQMSLQSESRSVDAPSCMRPFGQAEKRKADNEGWPSYSLDMPKRTRHSHRPSMASGPSMPTGRMTSEAKPVASTQNVIASTSDRTPSAAQPVARNFNTAIDVPHQIPKRRPQHTRQERLAPPVDSAVSVPLKARGNATVTPGHEVFSVRESTEIASVWQPQNDEDIIRRLTTQQQDEDAPPAAPVLQPRPLAAQMQAYTQEDDSLLIHLKDVLKMPWSQILSYFPGRTCATLQTRYCTKFSRKARMKASKSNSTRIEMPPMRGRGRPKGAIAHNMSTPETDSTLERNRPQRRLTRRSELGSYAQTRYEVEDDDTNTAPAPILKQTELKQVLTQLRQCARDFPSDRLIRDRELGLAGGRVHRRLLQAGIRDYGFSTLGPVKYMSNASGDVSTLAWSPDGNMFAAGAVCTGDTESMQYNKARNLVIGNVSSGNIKQLNHHKIPRPVVTTGVNASSDMRNTQDDMIYTTVQSVAFSASGRTMYSVSWDNCLNVYKVRDDVTRTKAPKRSKHDYPIDLLSVSKMGPVATGMRHSGHGAIQVFPKRGLPTALSAKKVTSSMRKYPSALRFGSSQHHSKYLLAGFSCEAVRQYEEDDSRDSEGEACLWDLNTGQHVELRSLNSNVFDVCWNPSPSSASTSFALASGASGKVNRGTHSVIRLYAPDQDRAKFSMELECPAMDINDVIYSPYDENIVAAGSTDGKVYIWDLRYSKKDQSPLYVLEHGPTLNVISHEKQLWEGDTGIRFLSWGADHTRLYSGSSDGVVKCWDPYRSDEDNHVRDVAKFQSAVMSGVFSPDHCSLLIGEDGCRLNLLAVGNEDKAVAEMKEFRVYDETKKGVGKEQEPEDQENPLSHIAARELIETGQVELRPWGALPIRQAVQGPNYSGPYRRSCKAGEREEAAIHQQVSFEAYQHQILVQQREQVEPCKLDCKGLSTNKHDEVDRFMDRIPEALRKTVKPGLEAQKQGLNARCVVCHGVARPSDDAEAICEQCNFSCFRCSQPVRISKSVHVIECLSCGLAWRVGVLGFELIEEGQGTTRAASTEPRMEDIEVEIDSDMWDLGDEERERQIEVGV